MQSEKVHLTKKQEGSGNMSTIVKASIFRLIQIAWSPIALVGYVLFVIKLIIVVAFDYFNADLIEAKGLYMNYAKAVLNAIGEPWRFGIESTPPARKHVAAFLTSCGLSMEEQRNFGQETDRKPAMAGFTTAIV
jgi:hypothetical protein